MHPNVITPMKFGDEYGGLAAPPTQEDEVHAFFFLVPWFLMILGLSALSIALGRQNRTRVSQREPQQSSLDNGDVPDAAVALIKTEVERNQSVRVESPSSTPPALTRAALKDRSDVAMELFNEMNMAHLQELCRRNGLTIRGTKLAVCKRLVDAEVSPSDDCSDAEEEDLYNLGAGTTTTRQLRAVCKMHGLSMSGRKHDLIKRLEEVGVHVAVSDKEKEVLADFGEANTPSLRRLCKKHNLTVRGTKGQLIERLQDNNVSPSSISKLASISLNSDDLDKRTRDELFFMCKRYGILSTGNKALLIKRIQEVPEERVDNKSMTVPSSAWDQDTHSSDAHKVLSRDLALKRSSPDISEEDESSSKKRKIDGCEQCFHQSTSTAV